jgi:integrase
MRITQRTVKALATSEEIDRIIWDSELKGFGVKRTASGVTYFLNYRSHGRQRRFKIGNAPEWTVEAARAEAAKIKPRIDSEGYDPLEAKQKARGEPTLHDLAVEYLKHREDKSASTRRNDKAAIAEIINPRLGKLRLAAVTRRDIEGLKASLQATPYRANRVLALLSHMFTKAIEWKWVIENPVHGIDRYQEQKRERWLNDDELKKLHEALDKHPDRQAANAIRLIALTGSRKGEVLQAKWEEFDFNRGVWTKPSHHTKQKKQEHVPLSEAVLTLLSGMKPKNAIGQVFPGRDGKSARQGLRKPWTAVCKAAGLAQAVMVEGKRIVNGKCQKLTRWKPTLRIHDLRHTFASHLVSKGTSLQIVGKLIGHTQMSTTMRYAHLADGALREAANDFGNIFNGVKPPLQVVSRKDARRKSAAGA